MRLEGTLDAFSLPDIFQLLSYTKKTGTLHLRRDAEHGVVHLRDGAVTGARSDVFRQALGRRLVGAGLVDDEALAEAVAVVCDAPDTGLARALADTGRLDAELLRQHGVEQATDAIFDLLRWAEGDFAFVMDELDPDDLGAALAVEDVVAEGRRRLESWDAVTAAVPSPAAVVCLAPSPGQDPAIDRDEWALLSLVDGSRTVADLVALSGRGEYVVVSALAALVERGLLSIGSEPAGAGALLRRQELLATLEHAPEPPAAVGGRSPPPLSRRCALSTPSVRPSRSAARHRPGKRHRSAPRSSRNGRNPSRPRGSRTTSSLARRTPGRSRFRRPRRSVPFRAHTPCSRSTIWTPSPPPRRTSTVIPA